MAISKMKNVLKSDAVTYIKVVISRKRCNIWHGYRPLGMASFPMNSSDHGYSPITSFFKCDFCNSLQDQLTGDSVNIFRRKTRDDKTLGRFISLRSV